MREKFNPFFYYGVFAVLLLVTLIVDVRIGLGLLLGCLFSFLNRKLIEIRVDAYLNSNGKIGFLAFIGYSLSMLTLVLPLFLSFLFRDHLHWAGAFLGLMYYKIFLIADAIIRK